MDNFFELEIQHNAATYNFPAELLPSAYSYKIAVDVFDMIILFEPDEERNFRAIMNPDDIPEAGMIDRFLLAAIAQQLVNLFKD